jgi:hypothetical protein
MLVHAVVSPVHDEEIASVVHGRHSQLRSNTYPRGRWLTRSLHPLE